MEDQEPRQIDWRQCNLVESVPEKVSGAPVLKGTRMPVQAIVDNYDDGLSPAEIAETFEIPLAAVTGILEFVGQQRARPS